MNWLNSFFKRIVNQNLTNEVEEEIKLVDEEYLFELEEKLLRADCGIEFSEYIVKNLRNKDNLNTKQAKTEIINLCLQTLKAAENQKPVIENQKLNIILIVGVNGAGKTTSIGKLAYKFKNQNKKVLIAPCDTFRAAASEQLQKWAARANVDILQANAQSKKADSVLYEALDKAQKEKYDILIVDTAGRLQNKKGLMDELGKLANVIDKYAPANSYIQRFLVIDATTGQNGYSQAILFNEATSLTGIILTKFDGSAKGGILFAINYNLKIPIKYLGLGEQIDQLQEFKAEEFVHNLNLA